jgi:hypothetical protein
VVTRTGTKCPSLVFHQGTKFIFHGITPFNFSSCLAKSGRLSRKVMGVVGLDGITNRVVEFKIGKGLGF